MMSVTETDEEREGKRWLWKELRAVCLTFRNKELPPHAYIFAI
jgi:hypothetical protein